ncbi:ribonuclease R [Peptoniphilus indolicus]|uniref:Ribonuclease R n=2 Tax=Peptoniphilus indolicus TaxID=33030 RepID=G4D373_9FIRM|nr:ribonuclease R [Peptoniphilus indolicus]EGY80035.1 ribonuclease R [Peptoniphilus indolicus ATCC 29427]SUB75067.1 Ribonuclease R [Peptoniphilus indolicus]
MIIDKVYDKLKDSSPMTKDKIYKVFEIGKQEKSAFDKVLKTLEKDGRIFFDGQKYIPIDGQKYRRGKIQGNERGFGFLLQADEDVFISQKNLSSALNGDEVLVKVLDGSTGHSLEGKVIQIIDRGNKTVVGTFQKKETFGFVVPDDDKIAFDIYIAKKDIGGAKDNQKVVVKIKKWPEEGKKPEGMIVEILGYKGEKGVDIMSIARDMNIPTEFSKAVKSAAREIPQKVTEKDFAGRKDLRELTTFTIDGADSKDFDDAISIEEVDGNLRLWVHIADVSHYVKESDEIDKEAYKRGNSYYLVDKVIPMLPEELSNGICSLNENVDRLAFSVYMDFDKNAKLVGHKIMNTVINSNRRLVYTNVSDFLENGTVHESVKGLEEDLTKMNELALKLRHKRMDRGSIDFDFPEAYIDVDDNGKTVDVRRRERRTADKLIEEFMLITNEVVAEEYFWMEIPFLYRIHEKPDAERVENLNKVLRHLGLKLNTQNMESKDFQKLIESVKGKDEELFVSTIALRSLMKARYSEINDIHFGLAAKYYSHFTSPIRRYSDLTIHRIMKDLIKGKLTEGRLRYLEVMLPEIADHVSAMERLAQDAERTVESVKFAEYMEDRIGEEYPAIITSITSFGMFAQLENTIEGLISYQDLDDYFEYDADNFKAIGRDTGKVYDIGDKVRVKVVGANTLKGTVDFVITEDIQDININLSKEDRSEEDER